MSRLVWELNRWVRHLGISGTTGVGLMVLALVLFSGAVLPAKKILSEKIATAVQYQQNLMSSPPAPAITLASKLSEFYQSLPTESSADRQVGKIYQLADKESLRLVQGEYQLVREKEGRIGRYQITLPVKGNYVQIRKFIARVMNTMPGVALNTVSFRRDAIAGNEVEAKIQFTIYLGAVP